MGGAGPASEALDNECIDEFPASSASSQWQDAHRGWGDVPFSSLLVLDPTSNGNTQMKVMCICNVCTHQTAGDSSYYAACMFFCSELLNYLLSTGL